MKNILRCSFGQNKSLMDLAAISVFILTSFGIIFYISGANPLLIDNDSWQNLNTAHRIYDKSSLSNISGLALDLAFDQVAQANYDLNNIKPYHFPIYPIFLSLFFHIYDNQFFVVIASQFLLCVTFLFTSHLILQNYLTRKESLMICLSAFLVSPLFVYTLDTGKEIFCPALATLCFYLGLYSKRRNSFLVNFCYFLIITILMLTRNFYILVPVFCLLYRSLPTRFKDDHEKENKLELLIFLITCILLPAAIYLYCHNYLDLFYFRRDRLEKSYFDVKIDYRTLLAKASSNLSTVWSGFNTSYAAKAQYHFFTISALAFCLYITGFKIKNFHIFFSKLFCIFFFYALLITGVTFLYEIGGYRMLSGFIPFAFYIFFTKILRRFKKGSLAFALPTIIICILSVSINFQVMTYFNLLQKVAEKRTSDIIELMKQFDTKIFALSHEYMGTKYTIPFIHKAPRDSLFVEFFYPELFCQELVDYSNHNINFKLIGLERHEVSNSCQFLKNNYNVIEQDKKNLIYVLKEQNLDAQSH